MHFILEEKLKELIGNIKLSSVTAENNWVFCPVACDFVWCLKWLGSCLTGGWMVSAWGLYEVWEWPLGGSLRLEGLVEMGEMLGTNFWSPRIRTSQLKVMPLCSHFMDRKTES